MSASVDQPSDVKPTQSPPRGPLPPVEPPTAGFILQLFLIPMVIVAIIVAVWMMFSWLAHMGSDPYDLARNLHTIRDKSWQDAAALADILRNPQHEHYKSDEKLAQELARVLEAQIDSANMSPEAVNLRIFLCRALGEFYIPTGLPVLTKAIETEREVAEIDVRRTALEAIAVLARNVGPETVRKNDEVMQAVLAASRERSSSGEDQEQRDQLRERAAFALGAIGGPEAVERLDQLLDDSYANARYNAATGLARYGDERSTRVLLEMLDPANPYAIENEKSDSLRDWKRLQVLRNGLRATQQLVADNPAAGTDKLRGAVERLANSDLEELPEGIRRGIHVQASETLQTFESASETAQTGS